MFSTLPKLADKAFVIGFLVPSILFLAVLASIFSDIPRVSAFLEGFHDKGNLQPIIYAVAAVAALAILTLLINQLFYRILEGYEWPLSKLPRTRELRRFDVKKTTFDELTEEWDRSGNSFPPEKRGNYGRLRREIVAQFPSERHLILPTRFGNAIRAFEDYSRDIYGADAIPLWIHLSTVIPKDYRVAVEEARANVSFFINVLFFSLIVFGLAAGRTLVSLGNNLAEAYASGRTSSCETLLFLAVALAALAISRVSYKTAIYQVYAWGQLVKAAFDCFLPDLAKKLGYQLPTSRSEQHRFWRAVSERAIYHIPLEPKEWVRADPSLREDNQGGEETAKNGQGGSGNNQGDGSSDQADAIEPSDQSDPSE
jgi:hypothetical protein